MKLEKKKKQPLIHPPQLPLVRHYVLYIDDVLGERFVQYESLACNIYKAFWQK